MEKKAEFTFQQIISIVLVIVLVVLVSILLFKAQIINYFKTLPGYQLPENSNDVNTDVSSDGNANPRQMLCPISVGYIENNVIYLGEKPNGQKTNLIWKGDDTTGKIIYDGKWKITKFWSNGNFDVAKIENGYVKALSLNPNDFDKSIIEQLAKINEAKYLPNIQNKLCKGFSE